MQKHLTNIMHCICSAEGYKNLTQCQCHTYKCVTHISVSNILSIDMHTSQDVVRVGATIEKWSIVVCVCMCIGVCVQV